MITREMIVKELVARGYNAEAHDVKKNGVIFDAIVIKDDFNISPTIYTKEILERADSMGLTLDEVVEEVIEFNRRHALHDDFDVNSVLNDEYVLENVRIGLQRESDENLIKRSTEYEGIESFLYIAGSNDHIGGDYSMRLNDSIISRLNVTESELWERAKENTFKGTKLESMASVLGMDESMFDTNIFVITNERKVYGASSIFDKEHISKFAKEKGINRFVLIPSSVHECLLIPFEEGMNIDYFTDMVMQVNSTEVDEKDQLADRAFIYNV